MGDYSITFARSARKELEALDGPLVSRIFHRIEALSDNPRPTGCAKLKGNKRLWRIRIEDYRVIYSIDDKHKAVDVTTIRHRSAAYR